MKVIIAGAGIGGLAVATVLRRQGHDVTIYEQSKLSQETGAAIFLPPNVNGPLRKFDFVPERYRANHCRRWISYTNGKVVSDHSYPLDHFPAPWQCIHRQELHKGLKDLAVDPSQPGTPVTIKTSSRVISADADSATFTFEDGSTAQGDLVIGADGGHSAVRAVVQRKHGSNVTPFSSGKNCFRFLISREMLVQDPVAKSLFESLDTFMVWHTEDHRLVCYPCDDNTTMNFVAIHPATLTDAAGKNWNSQGSKDTLLSLYTDFPTEIQAALKHVDPTKIRLYPLMDMDQLPGWTAGRVALLGDAAHPFLPYLGQGGAQAIEDAISLGVVFPTDVKPSDVPARLGLYERIRKDRAHRIQWATRISGLDLSKLEAQSEFNPGEILEYQMRHNELENSTQALAAHLGAIPA